MGIEQFLHADATFLYLIPFVMGKLKDTLARDASQNAAFERCSDDSAVDDEHHVHGTNLFDVSVLAAIKPKNLVEAVFVGIKGRFERGGVIATGLGCTQTSFDGSDVAILYMDAQWFQSPLVVGTGG